MSNVFYSNGTRMRFEDKLKCSKCQAAMRKIGVKFENLEVVEVHKCLACGKRRTREAIRTSSMILSLQGVQFILILKKTVLKVPFIDLKQEIEKFLNHDD